MATAALKVSGNQPRSKKVLKVLRVVQEHPEYSSGQIFAALRGAVKKQHIYGILAKYRDRLHPVAVVPQAQGASQASNGDLRQESLLSALALLKTCGGDAKSAVLHVETVAKLRHKV